MHSGGNVIEVVELDKINYDGDRGNKTALRFWKKINSNKLGVIASDYWKEYETVAPKEKNIQSKTETFTV